jgi:hypothetical protein
VSQHGFKHNPPRPDPDRLRIASHGTRVKRLWIACETLLLVCCRQDHDETDRKEHTVMMQTRDGARVPAPGHTPLLQHGARSCYAEVPAHLLDAQSRLIEQLISIAFDVLGARHLEVRVRPAKR